MAISLVLYLNGGAVEEKYVFEMPGLYTVGREAGCNLVIPKSKDRAVSRVHCKLLITDKCAYLRDIGSRNGTFVNGTQLENGGKFTDSLSPQPCDRPVNTGDIVKVGNSIFDAELRRGGALKSSGQTTIILPAYGFQDKNPDSNDDEEEDVLVLPNSPNPLGRTE